ncbi:hypothetical protein CDIK_1747 [Cucumispora dikerogammari]|nr:hypothetical protein CDIK_1747 [Cucumispora dikerogammari]
MLSLIYNLSSISSYKQPQEDKWQQGDITMCKNTDGELVDTPFPADEIFYMLEDICYKSPLYVFSVRFRVGEVRTNIHIKKYTKQLVRCSENMSIGGSEGDFVIDFGKRRDTYSLGSEIRNFLVEGSCKTEIKIFTAENPLLERSDTGTECNYYCHCWDQSKSDQKFKQALDMFGNKKSYKFRVVLTLRDSLINKFIFVHFETKPFSFYKKEDGMLALANNPNSSVCSHIKSK